MKIFLRPDGGLETDDIDAAIALLRHLKAGFVPPITGKVFDPSLEPARYLGQRGGRKGGKARTENMTPDERQALARKAAAARWANHKKAERRLKE